MVRYWSCVTPSKKQIWGSGSALRGTNDLNRIMHLTLLWEVTTMAYLKEVRAEISPPVRDLLQRCLYSDLDILLPKTSFAGAAELFFIVAISDALGGEAITKRIRKQLDSCEHIKQSGLIVSASYQSLEPIERNASESMEDFLENVAAKIQERINEEISSRMVKHG